MSESLENLKKLLDQCTDEERAALLDYLNARLPQHPLEREWGVGLRDITERDSAGLLISRSVVCAALNCRSCL